MAKKEDGGPAFPSDGTYLEIDKDDLTEKYSGVHFEHPGMVLRDYFAGQALTGIMANIHNIDKKDYTGMAGAQVVSAMSYKIADAMLAEREK